MNEFSFRPRAWLQRLAAPIAAVLLGFLALLLG